ncbi:hypothetical protein D3C79_618410 [compost metagenome]
MHAAPVDVAVLEHVGVVGSVFLGPGTQCEGRGVLQQLQAAARHREWRATGLADHAFAIVNQLGHLGILAGRLAYRVVKAEVAVARVDRHPEGGRVQFEQGLLPIGQRIAVLGQVGGSDHEQRLLVRVRVHRMLAGALERDVGRHTQPLAGERRDTAIGIAGRVRPHAGEVLAQALDILGRGQRHTRRRSHQQQTQGQAAARQNTLGHCCSPWLPIAVAQYR